MKHTAPDKPLPLFAPIREPFREAAPRTPPAPAFDLKAARDAADASIEQVAVNRSDWIDTAVEAIEHVARALGTFTVDDVQKRLRELGVDPPSEGRAMGAAMRRARLDRTIEPTGRYVQSAQVQCHGNPRMVWIATGGQK